MNSRKSYIVLALITIASTQSICAQSVKKPAPDQIRRNKLVKQLNNAYISLKKHLQCTVKGNCSAEEKQRIKKTVLWIAGAIAAFYIGRRILKGKDPTSLKVKPVKEGWWKKLFTRGNGRPATPKPTAWATLKARQSADYNKKRAALVEQAQGNPSIASNSFFNMVMDRAAECARIKDYGMANAHLRIAAAIISP